jgi:hypothetical protein
MSLQQTKQSDPLNKQNSLKPLTPLEKDTTVELKLGDMIVVMDDENEVLNNNTFYIDYIDETHMSLINTDTLEKTQVNFNSDGTMDNGTIRHISIISRSDEDGYARQHGLFTNQWVDVHFGGEIPIVFTGEITNLENDMIEITTVSKDVIYINFDYKGIPLDLPIEHIMLREKPTSLDDQVSMKKTVVDQEEQGEEDFSDERGAEERVEEERGVEERGVEEQEATENKLPPTKLMLNHLRDFILNADQIKFGSELGAVVQFVDVSSKSQRYSIDAQVTDLLDELLSTVPNVKRTDAVLNEIHLTIERFKQLRENFSKFDAYGNVEGTKKNGHDYKPLRDYFQKFHTNLYWLMPVVNNVKKIYASKLDSENSDIINLDMNDDLQQIKTILENYKSNSVSLEENKYTALYKDLDPLFTPFDMINPETNKTILAERSVNSNIDLIIDNLDDMYSSIYSNNKIRKRRFVIQKYNLGQTRLNSVEVTGSKNITKRVKMTADDTMSIKSFITLPEPAIRFSRINMPGTNILDKANLNKVFLNYWKFLKRKTSMNTIFVDDLVGDVSRSKVHKDTNADEVDAFSNKMGFNEAAFAKQITNYVLNLSSEEMAGYSKDEIYQKFTDILIPQIRVIFNLMKKYIVGKLSIVDVVSYLEPFLIYSDNLTYTQYKDIIEFINAGISSFIVNFGERSKVFYKLENIRSRLQQQQDRFIEATKTNQRFYTAHSIISLLSDENADQVLKSYSYNALDDVLLSNSELMCKLKSRDSMRLFSSEIALQNVSLAVPEEISSVLSEESAASDSSVASCPTVVVAKFYRSGEDLQADNGRELFFDRKYDTTNYGLLDDYVTDMSKLSPAEMRIKIQNSLKKRMKMSDSDADELTETLLTGRKRVQNGHYALLYSVGEVGTSVVDEYEYYVRKNNSWVKQANPVQGLVADDVNILCNYHTKCIDASNKCDNTDNNKKQLKDKLVKEMLNEFDEKYNMSIDDLHRESKEKYNYLMSISDSLSLIERHTMLKYNNSQYNRGLNVEKGGQQVESPAADIRDMILSQTNLVKKQKDIVRFVEKFARKAAGIDEPHWLYCKTTGVKLLPLFKYDLAAAFLMDKDVHDNLLENLKKTIGVKSDDGNKWVDKFSGMVIDNIDYDVEEGYEDGFKASSRAVLATDNSVEPLTKKTEMLLTKETKQIINIVNAVSLAMGINVNHQRDFIVNCVNTSLQNLEDEAEYNAKVKEMANRGKSIMSYADLCNSYLLYSTLGMFLIAVQTSVPSIKTRRTFPGCTKSFSGFPMDSTGDLSSLTYLSCVVYNIRKSSSEPWNVLKKTNPEKIASRIKDLIVEVLLPNQDVIRKMKEKANEQLTGDEQEIPEEYNVTKWTQFLPPLVEFKIKNLQNISEEFEKGLCSDMRSGSSNQRGKLLVVDSKIIQFSLAIQEKIQDIVAKKTMILHNANNEPFLENACCNGKGATNTIRYFVSEDATIKEYNSVVRKLANILADVNSLTKGGLFHSVVNTKAKRDQPTTDFNEQTIYLAFVHFCKFKSLAPVPPELLPLCKDKPAPSIINSNDSVGEMIVKLKNEGRDYSNETFVRLLQLIARNNLIDVDIDAPLVSSIARLSDVIETITDKSEMGLVEKLKRVLDTYDMATNVVSDETKALNNFLLEQIESMQKDIGLFCKDNKGDKASGISAKNIKATTDFIHTMTNWSADKHEEHMSDETDTNESFYTKINFMKMFIDNFVNVFPNIILNKVDYNDINVPAHWKLSKNHVLDIKKLVSEYYTKLKGLYEMPELYKVLKTIQKQTQFLVLLSRETPCFTNIVYKERKFKHIFNERTSVYLFKYYFLRIVAAFVNLTDNEEMIVSEREKAADVIDLFTVDEEFREPVNKAVLQGSKKDLKQKVTNMLVVFFGIMSSHKDTVNVSYDDIADRIFKSKEKEKNMITDRLKSMSDEERNADTILKINKLGVWSKGLQKGLTTYTKETYDDEREFMETMDSFDRTIRKKNNLGANADVLDEIGELVEEADENEAIDRENYDISEYGGENDEYDDQDYEDYN